MAEIFDRFNSAMEGYEVAALESAGYEEYRKQIAEAKRRDKITKKETGIDPKTVNENDPKYKAAQAAEKKYKFYVKETAENVRGSLDSILAETEPSKLVQALRFVPAKSDAHKDLAELVADYQMYSNLTSSNPLAKTKRASKKIQAEAAKRFDKKLPKIIQAYMMKQGVKEEKAKVHAEYLALVAGQEYRAGVVNDEFKRVSEELEGMKGEIASYLRDVLKKDEDYVSFGRILYLTHRKEEKDYAAKAA